MSNHKFSRAKKEVEQMLGKIIREDYADTWCKAKPRIDILMVEPPKDEAGNPTGPALTHHGAPAAATIHIVKLEHRALGLGDALIKIDAEYWNRDTTTDANRKTYSERRTMKAFCYTRTENEADAQARRETMAAWCGRLGYDFMGFTHDGLQGQLGLTQAKRRLEKANKGDAICIMVVWTLADIARDLTTLVKTLAQMNTAKILVHAAATDITLRPGDDPEARVVRALAEAHVRYVSENRKIGVRSARSAGAQIGRPLSFPFESHRAIIEKMIEQNGGKPPSARKLAKQVGCGTTKAAELINEWKAQQ